MTEPIRRIGPVNRSTEPVPPITGRRVERDDPKDREDREDAARDGHERAPRDGRPTSAAEPAVTPRPGPSPGHIDVQA